MNRLHILKIVTFITIIPTMLTGCPPARKGVPVGEPAAELLVNISNLNEPSSIAKTLKYELTGCGPEITGILVESSDLAQNNKAQVKFASPAFTRGMTDCNLQVHSPKENNNLLRFYKTSGMLYWATGLAISQKPDGTLFIEAPLQRLYEPKIDEAAGVYTLRSDVTFEAVETGSSILASLVCEPAFAPLGQFQHTTDTAGRFTFKLAHPEGSTDFDCKSMAVGVDGKSQKYVASFAADDGKFAAKSGEELTLPPLALELQQSSQPGGDGKVSVSTEGDSCKDGEYYDIEARECRAE